MEANSECTSYEKSDSNFFKKGFKRWEKAMSAVGMAVLCTTCEHVLIDRQGSAYCARPLRGKEINKEEE